MNNDINFNHLAWELGLGIYSRHYIKLSSSNLSPNSLAPDGASVKIQTEQVSLYGPHLMFQCLYWLTLLERAGKLEDLSSAKLIFPTLSPTGAETEYTRWARTRGVDDQPLGGNLKRHWQPCAFPSGCEVSTTTNFDSILCVTGTTIQALVNSES